MDKVFNKRTNPRNVKETTLNEVSEVTWVQSNNEAQSVVTCKISPKETKVITIPTKDERPCYRVIDEFLVRDGHSYKPGVYYFDIKPGKKEELPSLIDSWICSPLYVEAVVCDTQQNNFGRLLRFINTIGTTRCWSMPMEMLKSSGDELRGELLSMGVEIDPMHKGLLSKYIQSTHPQRKINCAGQVGWSNGSFVLPDRVIGPNACDVIFQSGERNQDEYTNKGTLEGWQREISSRAPGNHLLVLALSASFAGPLLRLCNAEGGGIHFIGESSTGKSTLIDAACATWGGENFKRSWRATANGIEGAAILFNDGLLALDEISECDPREVGGIVYALGNGKGKQRANRSGSAKGVSSWRCYVISSGERSIPTTMDEAGYKAKAGQTVRLLDISASRTFGAWDNLHGLENGRSFSDALKLAAITHHGHAGRAFLEKLTRDKSDFCQKLDSVKSMEEFDTADDEGQFKRAAARFAMLALAGELATEYGVTGWTEGVAIHAAGEAFKTWRNTRGKGNDEKRQIHTAISGFIERHGDSRFSDANCLNTNPQTRDRAGYWRDNYGYREYLFTAEGMREALKGFDFIRALDTLQESGLLVAPGADGKRAKTIRIDGRLMRLYIVKSEMLGVAIYD